VEGGKREKRNSPSRRNENIRYISLVESKKERARVSFHCQKGGQRRSRTDMEHEKRKKGNWKKRDEVYSLVPWWCRKGGEKGDSRPAGQRKGEFGFSGERKKEGLWRERGTPLTVAGASKGASVTRKRRKVRLEKRCRYWIAKGGGPFQGHRKKIRAHLGGGGGRICR